MKTHHWRWRSPEYLLLCGAKNGLINRSDPSDITCKTCLKMMAARGPDWQRTKSNDVPSKIN